MKKKVFFVLSSFGAGGSERVFWLLCQAFDKSKFEVIVVLLDTNKTAFSINLPGIRVFDLKTVRASLSFFVLLKLLRAERPFAVYSTGGQINVLVSMVSMFCKIPHLIARGTNIPKERIKYAGFKTKMLTRLSSFFHKNFNYIVCQSKEMFNSWTSKSIIKSGKLIIIPNPILKSTFINNEESLPDRVSLIIVARLSSVKGHDRLLDILHELPENYFLTIVGGDGGVKGLIEARIVELGLRSRINMMGQIDNVCETVAQHTLFVLSSYTEGFPNVVLEALSVGTPVVTFRVGGVSDFIVNGFNGYIVEQGNTEGFKECITKACSRSWDHQAIANDIQNRFSIDKVVKQYEQLII